MSKEKSLLSFVGVLAWWLVGAGIFIGFFQRKDWLDLAGTVMVFLAIVYTYDLWRYERKFWFVPLIVLTAVVDAMTIVQAVRHASGLSALLLGVGIPVGGLFLYLLGRYVHGKEERSRRGLGIER